MMPWKNCTALKVGNLEAHSFQCLKKLKEIERIMSKEKTFEFNPDRSFDERCEIVRETPITLEMTYEERLAAQRRRYGL